MTERWLVGKQDGCKRGRVDGWMDVRLYAVTDTELKGNTGLI